MLPAGLVFGLILVLLLGPGYVLARGLRIPPIIALAVAPSLILAAATVASVTVPSSLASGTPWVYTLWGIALVVTLLGAWLWIRSPKLAGEDRERDRRWTGLAWAVTAGAIGVSWVQVLTALGDPRTPLQRRDSVFHVNAIAGIRHDWATVHPVGVSDWMTGTEGAFYPSGLYAIGAAIPTDETVVTGNYLTIAAIGIWIIGMFALAKAIFPDSVAAWCIAPILTTITISYPIIPFYRHGQWPFGLSLALVPGVLALLIYVLRRRQWRALLASVIALVGIAGAHPSSAAFPIVLLAACALLTLLGGMLSGRVKDAIGYRPWMSTKEAAAVLAAVALLVAVASTSSQLRSMGAFERAQTPFGPLIGAVLNWSHVDPFEAMTYLGSTAFVIVTIAGFVTLLLRPGTRPFFVLSLVFGAILALSPQFSFLAHFTGSLWYGDPERMLANMTLLTIVTVTSLGATLGNWITQVIAPSRPVAAQAVSVVLAVLLVAQVWTVRSDVRENRLTGENYHPTPYTRDAVGAAAWSEGDADVWKRWSEHVGDDTIFTEPASGGMLLPAMFGLRTMPGTASFDNLQAAGRDTSQALTSGTPMEVSSPECSFIRQNNIRWIYVDQSYAGFTRFGHTHFTVEDVAANSEKVEQDGERSLWRITACDQ